MSEKNPKVDRLLHHVDQWHDEFEALREIVLGCDLTEELKWRQRCSDSWIQRILRTSLFQGSAAERSQEDFDQANGEYAVHAADSSYECSRNRQDEIGFKGLYSRGHSSGKGGVESKTQRNVRLQNSRRISKQA
jgi:hypothetical protein